MSSKNNISWRSIFCKYKILETINNNGKFVITSSQINEFREARLMTKFDYKSQLPSVFLENSLSILPISRGSYIISDFETFKDFDDNEVDIIKIDFPSYLESIDYRNITSESTALNCAYVSEIIHDFVDDEQLKPTVSGRMSSLSFNFDINCKNSLLNIRVDNSQIEIDGGYEGASTLSLIEAKNSISENFIIRQLYYPYRLWSNKVTKNVKSLFLTYTNGVFHLREYIFEDINHYNSIKLVRQKKYAIRDEMINIESIQKILNEIRITAEPEIPFPQADSFERVINLCELLNENTFLSKEYITENYDFNERQTNYYSDAGRYLGLIDKKENGQVIYFLTDRGSELFKLPITKRQIEFVKLILSHLVFKRTLEHYFEKADSPSKTEIIEIMKESNLYRVKSDTTFYRRASTISRWTNWIMELIEE
ncbi:MAG: hypothetical protein NTW85_12935 [Methylococcales bacterium]|nr:hypothetical protein [Methylococcales bacterium]